MSGNCRPSLRKKTLHNVLLASNLSNTDKKCIESAFQKLDKLEMNNIKVGNEDRLSYNLITKIIYLCANNYNEATFKHCLRVANYVFDNVCLKSDEEKEIAFIIAMCHDLLEDKNVSVKNICEISGYSKEFLNHVLGALTKGEGETYIEYIMRLKSNETIYPYIVKLADMKDHLSQRETLTERLKDKYWEALPYLL